MQKRLAELKQLLYAEEGSPNRSQLYIDDLKLSIASCERQIQNNKDKFLILNGVCNNS